MILELVIPAKAGIHLACLQDPLSKKRVSLDRVRRRGE